MFTRLRQNRGITIIETTVVLTVLFILAGAMSPIVSESVTMARAVRAKNDAQMIAMALVNLQRDLGTLLGNRPVVAFAATAATAAAPGVLATSGDEPEVEESVSDRHNSLFALLGDGPSRSGGNGTGRGAGGGGGAASAERRRWRQSVRDSLADHVTTNRRGYPYRRPGDTRGWNGPYLSSEIKGDPWGRQYLVNAEWLDGGLTAADADGRPRRAVFVVSPGANGLIETPYEQSITDAQAMGDDIVVRLQ